MKQDVKIRKTRADSDSDGVENHTYRTVPGRCHFTLNNPTIDVK